MASMEKITLKQFKLQAKETREHHTSARVPPLYVTTVQLPMYGTFTNSTRNLVLQNGNVHDCNPAVLGSNLTPSGDVGSTFGGLSYGEDRSVHPLLLGFQELF